MATALTETATFDPQVVVPEDGVDDETAASLVPAFQSLTDRTRALKVASDLWVAGGSAAPPESVAITTPSGKTIALNDLTVRSHADGGGIVAGASILGQGAAFSGVVTADSVIAGTSVAASTLSADTTVSATDVAASGNVTAGGHVTAGGTVSGVTVMGTVVVSNGNGIITSNLNVGGNARVLGHIQGKQLYNGVIGADADTSYAPASVDVVFIPYSGSPLTAGRTYTIDDTGAEDGMRILFANYDTAHGIIVNGIAEFGGGADLRNTHNNQVMVVAQRIAGVWHALYAIVSGF